MIFYGLNSISRRFSTFFTVLMIVSNLSVADSPSPYTSTTSVFIPYANAGGNSDLTETPTINVGFNGSGKYTQIGMDTGSVGIVASADIFTPARGAKYLGPGQQYYSSSGIIEVGSWWSATQQFYDTHGNLIATANVPVLQVTSIQCATGARGCTPNNNPTGIALMGIGFARESPQQPRGTPNYNAFLNLQRILQNNILQPLPVNWCNGYVVRPDGVYLGLTAANTANAGFVKLLPWPAFTTPQLSEWMAAPMTIDANGTKGNGNVLMDTGVGDAFLTPPPGSNLGPLVTCPGTTLVQCVPPGKTIGVYLPDDTNPVAHYSYLVGDNSNPMHPDGTHVDSGSDIFFNTSRHVLGGINFIYDNTNGYIGYIWNGNSSSSVGFVTPATTQSATTLISSANPAMITNDVTFTAIVTGIDSSQTPTGGITFVIDGSQQYILLDDSGVATFSTSQLTAGKHTIVAKYSGDVTYVRSVSPTLIQKIGL